MPFQGFNITFLDRYTLLINGMNHMHPLLKFLSDWTMLPIESIGIRETSLNVLKKLSSSEEKAINKQMRCIQGAYKCLDIVPGSRNVKRELQKEFVVRLKQVDEGCHAKLWQERCMLRKSVH